MDRAPTREHTGAELRAALEDLRQLTDWKISYGVFVAPGSAGAWTLERAAPGWMPLGSFLLLSGQRRRPSISPQVNVGTTTLRLAPGADRPSLGGRAWISGKSRPDCGFRIGLVNSLKRRIR